MTTARIVIELKGGMITKVLSNEEIEYVIVDKDLIIDSKDTYVSCIMKQDNKELPYYLSTHYKSPGDEEIRTALKQLNF